jgi:uncharacterized protein (DUF433 family)
MLDATLIEQNADVLGRTPVFAGTRGPAHTLRDYLAAGESLDDFPTVTRERATAVLELLKRVLPEEAP